MIPNDDFLFKMMRACIGVEYAENAWIYGSDISVNVERETINKGSRWYKR